MNPANNVPWRALPVLLAGAFMVVLDFFVVNVALPSIATDLHAGETALEWVVAGYGLSFAALLLLAGRAGDAFGRRSVYLGGLALFSAASAACGLAPTPALLVAARVVQGAAGAVVMPQVLSTIGVSFAGAAYARAMGIYGMALGVAAVGGQIVGGALVQSDVAGLGWRACFLINVPIGIAALLAAPRLVPETRARERGGLDVRGAVVLAAALVALLLPLIEGRRYGWAAWTWIALALAGLGLTQFARHQREQAARGRPTLLDLALVRDRAVSSGLLAALMLACAQASFFVYLALYLQDGRGLEPLDAGLLFTPVALGYVVASGVAPGLLPRGGRRVVAGGGVSLVAGFAVVALAVGEHASVLALVPGLAIAGGGIGLCYTPLTALVMSRAAPAEAGAASGVLATVQQVGYALGVALTGLVFFGNSNIGDAFQLSLLELAGFGVAILAVALLLPDGARGAQPVEPDPAAVTVSA